MQDSGIGVSGLCIWLFEISEILFAVLRHRLLLLTMFAVHYTLLPILLPTSTCTCQVSAASALKLGEMISEHVCVHRSEERDRGVV